VSRRAVLAALLLVSLNGCPALVAGGAAVGTIGGSLAIANEAAQLVGTTLSDTAKTACIVQAIANANGDSTLSTQAGKFCEW
jgi:hypothetical protein